MRIQATLTVRNYELLERRTQLGYTQSDLADMVSISTQRYSQIETLKEKPTEDVARSLALELNCDVDVLFPEGYESIVEVFKTKRNAITEYSSNLLESTPEKIILQLDAKTDVEDMMSILTPKEELIINMRQGLGEYEDAHTLEEVASYFGTSRERIRQIEAKIYEKMREKYRASHDNRAVTSVRVLTELSKIDGLTYRETRVGKKKHDRETIVFKAKDADCVHAAAKILVKHNIAFNKMSTQLTVSSHINMIISTNVSSRQYQPGTYFRKKYPNYKHMIRGVPFSI